MDSEASEIYRGRMRMILGLLLLVGCGGDGEGKPTDVVSCDAEWSEGTENPFNPEVCHRACAEKPASGSTTCKVGGMDCEFFVESDGAPGCCIVTEIDGKEAVGLFPCGS